jgi:predicted PhzF superfamily epimerase YddE/YHI9
MRIPYFQVNAFTRDTFGGNPAGVCPLEKWIPDSLLQKIAAENGFAETAYFVREQDHYQLRWFSPVAEVDLCGHATLASAYILWNELGARETRLDFDTRSGRLAAERRDGRVELDFPSRPPLPCPVPDDLLRGLKVSPREVLRARDYFAVYDSPAEVAALDPDLTRLARLDCLGIIVTAPGDRSDFVSRFFCPSIGVPEDPVTGSAHCTLTPYWSGRLGKAELFARQISRRGGELHCRMAGDRVIIAGHAMVYCRGELEV